MSKVLVAATIDFSNPSSAVSVDLKFDAGTVHVAEEFRSKIMEAILDVANSFVIIDDSAQAFLDGESVRLMPLDGELLEIYDRELHQLMQDDILGKYNE